MEENFTAEADGCDGPEEFASHQDRVDVLLDSGIGRRIQYTTDSLLVPVTLTQATAAIEDKLT